MKSVDWSSWLNASLIQLLDEPQSAPDPVAEAAVRQHLVALEQLGMSEANQGVWIQVGNEILAEHQGTTPLSAASLTKIATTLAALATWGPDRQFETLVGAIGPIESGVLQGNLVVQGGGDPFLVWEEAIALGNALNQAGISRVTGNLIITGNFVMNFETDPVAAGNLLKQGMNADLWTAEASAQYLTLPPNTPRPHLLIDGTVQVAPLTGSFGSVTQPLVRHQSLPLAQILKAMNVYSNNVMAETIANDLGGAQKVAQTAAEIARVSPEEIQLINGSGLGVENRISPRAICAMLIAIQRYLQPRQLNVADLFPIVGTDRGTPRRRNIPVGSAVKTGTLNEVSSLAGVMPTRDRGLVWFSMINIGTAELGKLHEEQDRLLQSLAQQWGTASPLPAGIRQSDRPEDPNNRLGAASRNQFL